MDAANLLARVLSHAQALGVFDTVNGHEPKSSPGFGLTAAVWVQSIGPIKSSGLPSTSGLVVFNVRIYTNMIQDPQDAIDPAVIDATDKLFAAYSADFDLGGTIRHIDLLGAYGPGLSAQAGYIPIDNKMYRCMTITVPLVINDLWEQATDE